MACYSGIADSKLWIMSWFFNICSGQEKDVKTQVAKISFFAVFWPLRNFDWPLLLSERGDQLDFIVMAKLYIQGIF